LVEVVIIPYNVLKCKLPRLKKYMAQKEIEIHRKSVAEKAVHVGMWGGFVAAILGTIRHVASWQVGGAGIAAASITLEQTVFKRKE
jgi:Mg/Co/Ni transporter MgtE